MKKPPPGRQALLSAYVAAVAAAQKKGAKKKAAPKKKPAAKKPAAGRAGGSGKGAPPQSRQALLAAYVAAVASAQKKGAAHKGALAAHQAHQAHLAHLAHLGKRPPAPPKHQRRQLALGEGVACCAAEALAASLRLTGRTVSDADVLALYRRTAGDPDTGATILATLQAASESGLGGVRLNDFGLALQPDLVPDVFLADRVPVHGLILGLDLPGPHAVFDDGSSWWSWGEPYDPACWPDAVIEEAWMLEWQ